MGSDVPRWEMSTYIPLSFRAIAKSSQGVSDSLEVRDPRLSLKTDTKVVRNRPGAVAYHRNTSEYEVSSLAYRRSDRISA